MENASNALIMAAGILIGILILSLAVFLFTDFGATSKEINNQMEEKQLSEYNAQYTIYDGRDDITIYEIITIANLAKENNDYYKDFSNYEDNYKVSVIFGVTQDRTNNLQDKNDEEKVELIKNYNIIDETGKLKYIFKGSDVKYHENGRIKSIMFSE